MLAQCGDHLLCKAWDFELDVKKSAFRKTRHDLLKKREIAKLRNRPVRD